MKRGRLERLKVTPFEGYPPEKGIFRPKPREGKNCSSCTYRSRPSIDTQRAKYYKGKTMAKRPPAEGELREFEALRENLERFVNFVIGYKKWIIFGFVVVVACGLALYSYKRAQIKKEETASFLLSKALSLSESEERILALGNIIENYPNVPSSILARYFRGREFMDRGQWDEAEGDLRMVIKRGPPTLKAEAFCLLGDVMLAKGHHEEALEDFRACGREGRGWLDAYALLKEAMTLDRLGRSQEAIKAYEKVLPLLPSGEIELFVRMRLKELGL